MYCDISFFQDLENDPLVQRIMAKLSPSDTTVVCSCYHLLCFRADRDYRNGFLPAVCKQKLWLATPLHFLTMNVYF